MDTRGLKSLFAGGVSSVTSLAILQATLYLIGPILRYDVIASEFFFENMLWVINSGIILGSIVSIAYIDKESFTHYFIAFMATMFCHFNVFLTVEPDDEFKWVSLGVILGTFSTICQFKVILRSSIYENKGYKLGLIPLAIAGISFGNIIGVGVQHFVLKRFPLNNIANEKTFLIYIWMFAIIVMIFSVKIHFDAFVEIDSGDIYMNKDRSISIFTHGNSYKGGIKSFKLVINPLLLYLTCCILDSFFIPGSVNISTDSFHHLRNPWDRHALLFIYNCGFFLGCLFSHYKSRVSDFSKSCTNSYDLISWPLLWIMLIFIRLPFGVMHILMAHYQNDIPNYNEIIMYLSATSTMVNGIITGITTSLALVGLFVGVVEYNKIRSFMAFNKARVILSYTICFGNYLKIFFSWISRKYLALFAYALRQTSNGNIWPTANESNMWNKFKWWVCGTITFLHMDIQTLLNNFMILYREVFNY